MSTVSAVPAYLAGTPPLVAAVEVAGQRNDGLTAMPWAGLSARRFCPPLVTIRSVHGVRVRGRLRGQPRAHRAQPARGQARGGLLAPRHVGQRERDRDGHEVDER